MKKKTPKTPFEQAAICLSLGRYRRAAEILIQIIMEQDKRIKVLEDQHQIKYLPPEEPEYNFTDGLEEDDNF